MTSTSKDQGSARRKPGPAPDASKPNSRHNPTSTHHSVSERVAPRMKTRLEAGSVCKNGHALTAEMLQDTPFGARCKWCMQNKRREKMDLPPLTEFLDARSMQQKKSHCKRGHEYVEGSFYARLNKDGYLQRQCKECGRQDALASRYNLSPAQFASMFELQGERCALCNVEFFLDKRDKPVVDHDHVSGKVRGLLCSTCDKGLGMLGDTADTIKRALAYVQGESRVRS